MYPKIVSFYVLFLILHLVSFYINKPVNGQPFIEGRYQALVHQKQLSSLPVDTVLLPYLDNTELKAGTQEKSGGAPKFYERDSGEFKPIFDTRSGPHKFGSHVYVGILDCAHNGTWSSIPSSYGGGRSWRLKIVSPNAISLNLVFDRFKLPVGSELYVRGEQRVLGAYTAELNNKPHMKFTTAPLLGKSIMLEYFEQENITEEPLLSIKAIVHGFDNPFGRTDLVKETFTQNDSYHFLYLNRSNSNNTSNNSLPDSDMNINTRLKSLSQNCHANSICPHHSKLDAVIRSVVHLTLMDGSATCTGALINNALEDGKQFLLTALHCVEIYQRKLNGKYMYSHDNDIITFNFESSVCAHHDRNYFATNYPSLQGLEFVTGARLSDFALFKVKDPIPENLNVYMAGWSINSNYLGPAFNRLYTIHHPNGDVKKISYSYEHPLKLACWHECSMKKRYHILVTDWDKGATEQGSSGAPLFDSEGSLIGQLHGGASSCFNLKDDLFGAISSSYSMGLEYHIDPKREYADGKRLNGRFLNELRSKRQPNSRNKNFKDDM